MTQQRVESDSKQSGLRDKDLFPTLAYLSHELGREVDIIQLEGHLLAEKVVRE
jgi:hypothetical protein